MNDTTYTTKRLLSLAKYPDLPSDGNCSARQSIECMEALLLGCGWSVDLVQLIKEYLKCQCDFVLDFSFDKHYLVEDDESAEAMVSRGSMLSVLRRLIGVSCLVKIYDECPRIYRGIPGPNSHWEFVEFFEEKNNFLDIGRQERARWRNAFLYHNLSIISAKNSLDNIQIRQMTIKYGEKNTISTENLKKIQSENSGHIIPKFYHEYLASNQQIHINQLNVIELGFLANRGSSPIYQKFSSKTHDAIKKLWDFYRTCSICCRKGPDDQWQIIDKSRRCTSKLCIKYATLL